MIIDRDYDYYEDERLYSTGDQFLDSLLEKAFCDGYEYAQREYARINPINRVIRNRMAGNIRELRRGADAAQKLAGKYGNNKTVSNALRQQSSAARDNARNIVQQVQSSVPKTGKIDVQGLMSTGKNKSRIGEFVHNYQTAGTRYGVGM